MNPVQAFFDRLKVDVIKTIKQDQAVVFGAGAAIEILVRGLQPIVAKVDWAVVLPKVAAFFGLPQAEIDLASAIVKNAYTFYLLFTKK